MKNVGKKHGIQTYFRGGNTIKSLMMTPKDKDHISKNSGIIYRFKCNRVECDDEYIGESSRTFGERFKECFKAPPPIYDHYNITGHETSIENFSIVGREDQNLIRAIKEAIYIRVNNPSLNRNIGKYYLPHIWDEVLLNNSELKLKWIHPSGYNIYHMAITSTKPKRKHFTLVAITSATWQQHLPQSVKGNNLSPNSAYSYGL